MATELISLGILFLCAIIGGTIATRFKQPAVFGMLLVGALIGPKALNLVQDHSMIEIMAEFGAILLLFIIGLEFDISKLVKLGARSMLIGILKFAIVVFFGYQTTLLLGFSTKVALFIGVILSFSSTVVVVKVLEQKELFSRKEVPLLIAILIIEDIIAVFILTFFSGINGSTSLLSTFERIIFSIAILILAYYLMMKILKLGVNLILKNNSDESVLTFLSLGIGALFSYFAFSLGLTPSAGAFLAGSLIASLPNSKEYGKAIHPYAMIFTSIFFISMGTLVDFGAVKENIALIAALLITIFVSRIIAVGFFTFLLANFKNEQPLFSSIAMISVGEFSLLVAKESEKFGLGIDLVTITASIIFLSAIVMSLSINHSESIHQKVSSRIPMRAKIRLEKISSYMRKFFDQLDIENFFTKKLKAESKSVFALFIIALFSFFILRKIVILMEKSMHPFAIYLFYAASAALMLFLLSLMYRKVKAVHETTAIILTNVDSSRNLKKCTKILNNLATALFLLLCAMLLPFVIFMMDLNTWTNSIPFVLVFAAFYFIRNLIILIDGHPSHSQAFAASLSAAKF